MTISRDEWMRAMEEAGIEGLVNDRDAVTAPEFSAMFGMSAHTARTRLEQLVEAGKATRTRKRVHHNYAVAYRLVP